VFAIQKGEEMHMVKESVKPDKQLANVIPTNALHKFFKALQDNPAWFAKYLQADIITIEITKEILKE
jgi:hypothetical protein